VRFQVQKHPATVVLVGRPNVGKSTLFNRLTGTRRAIVAPVAGTTRDSIGQPAVWRGVTFQLTDTGGMFGASEDPLHELVVAQGRRALTTADLVVFMVDGRDGKLPDDNEIAGVLRHTGVPVILAINKMDDRRARDRVLEFYQLGFDPVLEIAAEHGIGTGDLLDEIIKRLPSAGTSHSDSAVRDNQSEEGRPSVSAREPAPAEIAVAIVGRPNVGKSSLVNRMLREERVLVSDMPGTTRDAVDAVMTWYRREFRIVDTAGIRRPGRVARAGQVEAVSVLSARRALARADIAVIVMDAVEGPTDQDAAIAGEAEKAGRGIVLAVNKWDLVEDKGPEFARSFDEELRRKQKFLDYAPVLHISARTGLRTIQLLETIDKVAEARKRRVPTGELNRFVENVTAAHPPASPGRRQVRVLYVAQVGAAPPVFVFFTNVATTFHFSYERFLVNRLRDEFGFLGTPIRIEVRARARARRP
jgi:GTP-binding protein